MPKPSSLAANSHKSTPFAFGEWIDTADVHRDTYRIFCVLVAVLNPVFGIVYHYTNPADFDPLWMRVLLSVPFLGLLGFSYANTWVKDHFTFVVHGFFYILITFYVGLTTINHFAPNYALGLLFVITAVGIAFSLGLKQTEPLVRYLGFSVILTVIAVFAVPEPRVSPVLVGISVLSTAIVIYVVARSKISAETTAKASERRYHTLMNAAKDAIFIIDPETDMLVDANQQAQTLIGRTLDMIRRMRPSELYPEDRQEQYRDLFNAHVFEERPISEDFYVEHRSGRRTPVDVNASLISIGAKQFIQGIFRDATERHDYEEQLIQSKERAEELLQLKSSFLNNMSHELRTPLTGILGYAEVLSEEAEGEQREFALTIAKSAKRLYHTLNSVLDLAQLDGSEASLELERLDVAEEVKEVVNLLGPMAEEKGLALRMRVSTTEVHAELDPTCLSRIINNLVGNAIKFTEEGQVSVEVSGDSHRVRVHVGDTGIGISEEFKERLFDEFRQESSGLARSHEGNGLGLAITRRLVDLMDGAITLESTKGVGSTFTVSFPSKALSTNGHAETHETEKTPQTNGASQKRILIVEDNAATRNLLEKQLGSHFRVTVADSPTVAFRLARTHAFDLFLLDIHLNAPQDGLDVLRALRTMPEYTETPAVALTAYAMPDDRDRFLNSGFDGYLGKPYIKDKLMGLVQDVFSSETHSGGAHVPH